MSADKTIFQRIIDKEIPATFLHEDDRCIAIRDINAQAPTHVLVIPKKKIDRLQHMDEDDEALVGHLLFVATRVAHSLKVQDGFRLVINDGASAGQTVFHLHVHLLAGRSFGWPPG